MGKMRDAFAAVCDVFQSHRWISGPEAAQWAETTTLVEMGWMTIRWLNGELAGTPGYTVPVDVDEEIAPGITDALIALNLAGFLTHNSQGAYDGPQYEASPWEAWVDGFADDDTYEWLTAVATGAGLGVYAWPPAASRSRWTLGRSTQWRNKPAGDATDGHPKGIALSASYLDWMYGVCSEQAVTAVCAAWQVTIYDPEPGRNEMWELLRQAAEDRLGQAA